MAGKQRRPISMPLTQQKTKLQYIPGCSSKHQHMMKQYSTVQYSSVATSPLVTWYWAQPRAQDRSPCCPRCFLLVLFCCAAGTPRESRCMCTVRKRGASLRPPLSLGELYCEELAGGQLQKSVSTSGLQTGMGTSLDLVHKQQIVEAVLYSSNRTVL